MAEGCCGKLSRLLLVLFNIVFLITGLVLLGIGIWISVDTSIVNYVKILEVLENGSLLKVGGYAFIAVGASIFIIAVFGCCGAIKENTCCLGIYMILLVLVMAIEVAGGVLALLVKNKLQDDLEEELQKALTDNYGKLEEKKSEAFTEGLDFIQKNFKCCGIVDADVEYPTTQYWEDKGSKPESCCEDLPDSNGSCTIYFAESCKDKIYDFLVDNAPIIVGVGIGIACIQILGFIFALCMCRDIGNYKELD